MVRTLDGLGHGDLLAEVVVRARGRSELDIGLLLKDHHDVRASELEVGELVALLDLISRLDAQHHGRHLRHADRQHRDETDVLRLDEDEGASLDELVARIVRGR